MDAGVNHNQQLLTPGDRIDLSNCDLEPIHIPSSIQAHGLVVAARSTDLQILYAYSSRPLLNSSGNKLWSRSKQLWVKSSTLPST
jgi:light-regulated signal transduction histidine kinase (bacteriophytochrome)